MATIGWMLAATVTLVTLAAPLSAQTLEEQKRRCEANRSEISIAACTAVIQSGRGHGVGLAIIFYNRGDAYQRLSEFERAIEDFDQAIRLNSAFAGAFHSRALAYAGKRQYARAIEDFD